MNSRYTPVVHQKEVTILPKNRKMSFIFLNVGMIVLFGCTVPKQEKDTTVITPIHSLDTTKDETSTMDPTDGTMKEENNMKLTINGNEYAAVLAETAAAKELRTLLPITMTMQELNGNEKHGDLPASLPQDIYQPGTIHTGDILLWGEDTLVLFYQDFPTPYSYTEIGHLDDPTGLAAAIGAGNIQVSFQE